MSEFNEKVRFELDVPAKRFSDSGKALLVVIDGADCWVPVSQIDDDSEVFKPGDEGTLVVNEWWARQAKLA